MTKFQIKNRFTGVVQFECELSADIAQKEYSLQLGFAVKKAVKVGANLVRANLVRASLAGANLDGANLYRANLDGANLIGANLGGANLDGANLYRANLDGANLDGANLNRANLAHANLTDANLIGAKYFNEETIYLPPVQISGFQHWGIIIAGTHMKIGCELHTIEDWDKLKKSRIKLMDERAADWWEEYKPLIMSIAKNHMEKHLIKVNENLNEGDK
jgi:uncharacterized protein YjbI with pentapeptide repeats